MLVYLFAPHWNRLVLFFGGNAIEQGRPQVIYKVFFQEQWSQSIAGVAEGIQVENVEDCQGTFQRSISIAFEEPGDEWNRPNYIKQRRRIDRHGAVLRPHMPKGITQDTENE